MLLRLPTERESVRQVGGKEICGFINEAIVIHVKVQLGDAFESKCWAYENCKILYVVKLTINVRLILAKKPCVHRHYIKQLFN